MGGQAGSRGYIYQGIAAIFESLKDIGWDKIYVEYSSPNDKVDIALKDEDDNVIKSIQVKSSINLFQKSEIIRWSKALIEDMEAKRYQLILIGACDVTTNTFIKSISKYNSNKIDEETVTSLQDFTKILDKYSFSIIMLPFDEESLISVMRDKIHRYISYKGYALGFSELEELSYALLSMQMFLGTKGAYISKDDYDEKIFEWLKCSADGALQREGNFSSIMIMSYYKEERTLTSEIRDLSLGMLHSYRKMKGKLILDGKSLIDQISAIHLPRYYKPTNVADEVVTITKQFIDIGKLMGPQPAERSVKDQKEITKKVKEYWDIELEEIFFNVGNLTKNKSGILDTDRYTYSGTEIEKQKDRLISELYSIIFHLDILKYIAHYMDKVRVIPLCIKNVSDVSDQELTIRLNLNNVQCQVFDINKHFNSDAKAMFDTMADILIREDILKDIFKIEGDDIVGIEISNTFHLPSFKRSLGQFYEQSKYNLEDLISELEIYQAQQVDGVVEYEINSLRAGETKWLSPYLVLVLENDKVEIPYSILSKHLGNEIKAKILIEKK